MRRLMLVFATLVVPLQLALAAPAQGPDDLHMRPKKKLSSTQKRARAATHEAPIVHEPRRRPVRSAATPVVTSPGAQLGPNRPIEAPQAPGPDSSPPREVVPAAAVQKRDRQGGDVQPPYPTGYDPGRNLQGTQGFSPSSQSVVP